MSTLSNLVADPALGVDAQEGGADSAPGPVQAPTDVSAAGIVLENQRPHSSVSEGVASVGGVPQPVVGEFVPSTTGDPGTHSLAAGFQGETSGLNEGGATIDTDAFGETGAAGGSPMEALQPRSASAQFGGTGPAAASHHASRADAPHAKRKMSEMGEVGDAFPTFAAAGAAVSGGGGMEEVQECDMRGQSAQQGTQGQADESDADGLAGGGLNRVPSDVAMVTGDAPFEPFDALAGASAEFLADSAGMLPDDCDSNMARAIQASLEDARAQQQQQQQQQAAPQGGHMREGGADSTAVDLGRPSDADIIAWENQIKEAEVRRVPLVGDREPLDALAAEYEAGSAVYRQKIDALRQDYGSIRRTRGDGNCFFRSFLFGYLEHLLLSGDAGERDRAVARLQELKKALAEVGGYDEIVLETPMDMVLQLLRGVAAPLDPLTIEGLEASTRDEEMGAYPVWLLRMVTSSEIKRRADFFAPFVMGLADLDVASFCAKCVDPMGEEADHVQLVALTDALQVPIRVVYLDRSLAPGGGGPEGGGAGSVHVDMHDFVPEGCPAPTQPRVHLLYRPGHYDLLYLRHG